ncbi:MAG TPA: DUF2461 domain-containing protein [Chloroflexota bacterium]|jgi:uncharacterized protein (TIGR02453 family)
MAVVAFQGFAAQLTDFLRELREHNERDWFQAHRDEYERYVLEPARECVLAIGERIGELGEDIHAEPKVRGSILAINRDTRFSPDKTPYKAYLDLWFWQGDGPSRERPGYFIRIEPERTTLGAGMHLFSDQALAAYRSAVEDKGRAAALQAIMDALPDGYEVGGKTLKRVPKGFTDNELLKHTGLFASTTTPPEELFDAASADRVMGHFRNVAPLQQWLVSTLPR